MKLPLKHIVILVICSLIGIFVYQAYWLTGLYRTMKSEMESNIRDAMRTSDFNEVVLRINDLQKDNVEHGSVTVSAGYDADGHSLVTQQTISYKGVRLYAPIELDGQRVEKLVWNADEKTFSSPDGTTRLELIADPLGLREEQFLGEYALSYTGKKTDVSISKQPNGGILMKGLPFDVRLTYNSKKGALELNSQQLKISPDIRLAIWCSQLGNLTWSHLLPESIPLLPLLHLSLFHSFRGTDWKPGTSGVYNLLHGWKSF